jgi:hypothetical protein
VSSQRGLTRGGLVGALLAAGAALVPLRPWRVLVELEPRAPAARLPRLLRDPVAARAIGAEYLRTRPGEATAAALVDAMAQSLPGGRSVLTSASDRALRSLLAERSRADFTEGKTVILRRWILSETEARLCALASIRRDARGAGDGRGVPARERFVSRGQGRSRPSRRASD